MKVRKYLNMMPIANMTGRNKAAVMYEIGKLRMVSERSDTVRMLSETINLSNACAVHSDTDALRYTSACNVTVFGTRGFRHATADSPKRTHAIRASYCTPTDTH